MLPIWRINHLVGVYNADTLSMILTHADTFRPTEGTIYDASARSEEEISQRVISLAISLGFTPDLEDVPITFDAEGLVQVSTEYDCIYELADEAEEFMNEVYAENCFYFGRHDDYQDWGYWRCPVAMSCEVAYTTDIDLTKIPVILDEFNKDKEIQVGMMTLDLLVYNEKHGFKAVVATMRVTGTVDTTEAEKAIRDLINLMNMGPVIISPIITDFVG